MRRRAPLFVIVLASLLFLATAFTDETIPDIVRNGLYSGRSGNIIIKPEKLQTDAAVFLSTSLPSELTELQDTQFSLLLSHLMGTLPLSFSSLKNFPSSSLFTKPQANLFISIEGLGLDTLNKVGFSGQLLKPQTSVKLVPTSYPNDYLSLLTTIRTGVTPKDHGVVSSSWLDKDGNIIEAKREHLETSNFADGITESFAGRSLLFSFSSNKQALEIALAAEKSLVKDKKNSQFAFYWNGETFVSLYNKEQSLSKEDILLSFETRNVLFEDVQGTFEYDKITRVLYVTIPSLSSSEVAFDLKSEEDFLFFAEVEMSYFLSSFLQQLQSRSALSSHLPAFFSLSLSGLKNIEEKYGADSSHFKFALTLLDAAMTKLVAKLNSNFNERLLTSVVIPGSLPQPNLGAQESQAIAKRILKKDLVSEVVFSEFWPRIFLKNGASSALCSNLESHLWEQNLEVYCPDEQILALSSMQYILRDSGNSTSNSTSGSSGASTYDITILHTVMWTSIGMVATLIAIVLAMVYMDVGKDSIVYRAPASGVTTLHKK